MLNRNHQTAVFVVVPAGGATSKFTERATRFANSLNDGAGCSTIKADVYTVHPGQAVPSGGIVPGLNLKATLSAAASLSDDELVAQAREAGYVQAVIVRSTGI